MSDYMRAKSAYTINDFTRPPGDQTLHLERGDLVPASHWAVQQATAYFEPATVDAATAEAVEALAATRSEMAAIAGRGDLRRAPAGQRQRHDNLARREARLLGEIRAGDQGAKQAELYRLSQNPGNLEPGYDTGRAGSRTASGNTRTRDVAMRFLDAHVRSGGLPGRAAERVEAVMDGSANRPLAERWAAAGSDPAYVSAFMKALSGERGHLLWNSEEAEAYRRVEAVRAELRSMSAIDGPSGGFQVPVVIDPAIRISSDGSISPMRELAEVRSEIGQTFRPVTSDHVVNQWTAEAGEVPDGTPELESPAIAARKATSFVPFSFEYQSASFGGAIANLTELLTDGYDQLTAEAFLNGNGTTQPEGVWTGAEGTTSEVAPDTAGSFDADVDVYAVQNALPARFQANATWLANLATLNTLSAAETASGAPRFPDVGGAAPVLLRKPVREYSNMRGTGDLATGDNPVLIYGDIRRAYTIVDFAGSSVELVPHLFGANRRPTGQRGLLLWARVGAGVVIPNAVRVLNVAVAA